MRFCMVFSENGHFLVVAKTRIRIHYKKKMSEEKVVGNDMDILNLEFRNNTNLVKMYGDFLSASQDIGTKML